MSKEENQHSQVSLETSYDKAELKKTSRSHSRIVGKS
jgi:hypothetical protein